MTRRTTPAEPSRSRARSRRRAVVAAAAAVVAIAAGAWAVDREAGATTGDPLHADTRLGTVELLVADLELQRSFYDDVLGLDLLDETAETVRLGAQGEELIRLVRTDAPAPRVTEAGLYHSAILYPDAPSLAAVLQQVAASAPESYQGASDHTVSQAFYLTDPEGNGVELYVDRPRTSWQWDDGRVQMGSAPLDPNAFIAEHQGDQPAAAPTVGHVHLKVGDLDDARRFYVDVLGFEITSEIDGALFMSAGGYHHHLAANTWSSDGAGRRSTTTGLGSFEVLLATAQELEAVAARLDGAEHPYDRNASSVTVTDPWGTAITLTSAGGPADPA